MSLSYINNLNYKKSKKFENDRIIILAIFNNSFNLLARTDGPLL